VWNDEVAAAIEAAVGHPDMRSFSKNIGAAKTFPEMEEIVREASARMEFICRTTGWPVFSLVRKPRRSEDCPISGFEGRGVAGGSGWLRGIQECLSY
jgi:hypothetical protein